MTTRKILDILCQLGFKPELLEDNIGYKFEYEGLNLLLSPEDEESHTVCLMLPGMFDITDDNRLAALKAMVLLTANMKFVQPIILSDSIWLSYQHFLGSNEPTPEIIEHMIRVLALSYVQFNKFITDDGNDE